MPSQMHFRLARPVGDLARSSRMYREGLGLSLLGEFHGHDGFDGAILGTFGQDFHFEFTHCRHHPVAPQPTAEDLAVFYLPDAEAWRERCAAMLAAGFTQVSSFNPYWDQRGASFADADGYRVVLQNAAWVNEEEETAAGPDA